MTTPTEQERRHETLRGLKNHASVLNGASVVSEFTDDGFKDGGDEQFKAEDEIFTSTDDPGFNRPSAVIDPSKRLG